MINEVKAYRVGEILFSTIEEAQEDELLLLLMPDGQLEKYPPLQAAVHRIIQNTDEVVAILTCAPKSKSKAPRKPRSDIGKKRKLKDATPAIV